ncbi:MAG: adenylosuccinate synthase [Deltaproteobacteria bacterium]|nr:adenylosuccinate synthase [Deltaproteobacteria bacterium]
MSLVAVIGIQWGDEGKGKIVDLYSKDANCVVRYQGGSNAGHTVAVGEEVIALHHIPSGILYPNVKCLIGSGVVVDPYVILDEINMLREKGFVQNPAQLAISPLANMIMPYHRWLDVAREQARGERKIGTTGRGVGPAQEDRVGRRGIRMYELLHEERLEAAIAAVVPEKNALLEYYGVKERVSPSVLAAELSHLGKKLTPFIQSVDSLLFQSMARGENVLFEGAQGVLLDLDIGSVPYVTSSNTTAATCLSGAGVMVPHSLDAIIGVSKAYATRVGEGPFPTEQVNEDGSKMREIGGEFGTTTGRARRCGWLDLVALKYAVRVSGCTALAITKIDVLSYFDKIQICTGYRMGDETVSDIPDAMSLTHVQPYYEESPGWKEDLTSARHLKDLPMKARHYIDLIEDFTKCPVVSISVGPRRDQTIERKKPWKL